MADDGLIDQTFPSREPNYRLFVNEERTVLVRLWAVGTVEVATRQHQAETWGRPVYLTEEKV